MPSLLDRSIALFFYTVTTDFSSLQQESRSFAMNLFRGKIATEQVFPFPEGKDL